MSTPNTDALINSARCIDKCIPDGEKMAVMLSLLYQILQNGGAGGIQPNTIATLLAVRENEVAIAASNIDWSLGAIFTKTLTANTVFTFSNVTSGRIITVAITGDAASTVTWPAAVKWPAGVAPTQTLSKVDVYTFIGMASGAIYGSAVQNIS